jgi:ABC-type uncharacterized transport system ATPase subunit
MSDTEEYYLEMEGVSKTYPNGVRANRDVDFYVKQGEIHGLVGENGAGKTTLMKVLYGLEDMDGGTIILDGDRKSFHSPEDAIRSGIGMVHQHFRLASGFSVAENVVLGQEPGKGPRFDLDRAVKETAELVEDLRFDLDVTRKVADLSVGKRQYAEILRLIYQGADTLVLDEPTAVLTPQETEDLLKSLRELVDSGHTLIFITHKIEKALAVSDVLSVMRDGEIVGERVDTKVSQEEISRLMVGREVSLEVDRAPAETGELVLETRNLTVRGEDELPLVDDVSLGLQGGEILGIAAVQGNGQSELVEALSGLREPSGGEIFFLGRELEDITPGKVRALGLSYVPEDRTEIGVASEATVTENLALPWVDLPGFSRSGLLQEKQLERKSGELISKFDITVSDPDSPVSSLSGGNVQKLVLARELSRNPKILLAAQPTRGLDIKTKRFVWDELLEKRSEGTGILLVSSDLPEVRALSDRIAVMYEGSIVARFDEPERVSDEDLGLFMMGTKEETS